MSRLKSKILNSSSLTVGDIDLKVEREYCRCLTKLEEFTECSKIMETNVEKHIHKYGVLHWNTLEARAQHAWVLGHIATDRTCEDSLIIYDDLMKISKKNLSSFKYDSISWFYQACEILELCNEINEHLKVSKDIVEITERIKGPHHFETLKAYYNYGQSLKNMVCKPDDAIKVFESIDSKIKTTTSEELELYLKNTESWIQTLWDYGQKDKSFVLAWKKYNYLNATNLNNTLPVTVWMSYGRTLVILKRYIESASAWERAIQILKAKTLRSETENEYLIVAEDRFKRAKNVAGTGSMYRNIALEVLTDKNELVKNKMRFDSKVMLQ